MGNCSICSDRAKRDLVDAALRRGDRPAEVARAYSGTASRSSIYRHANHSARGPLAARWVAPGTSLGEVLTDLESVRAALVEAFGAAVESGADTAARGAAREVSNLSGVLLKAGLGDDDLTSAIVFRERLVKALQRAATSRPEFADELAGAARVLGDHDLAADAIKLGDAARNKEKKN